jgi:drug/metabolite transporter (DMT)-like permease
VSARAWTLFAAVSTLWGVPYLFIKIGVDGGVPPFVLAWARIVLGAAVLLGLAARSGLLHQVRGHWRGLVAYAVLEISLPFPLIATGERHVASSLAAIIIAAVPLIVALLALRFDREERATGRRLVGLLTGLLGVVLLVGLDASGSLTALLSAGAILLAAVGYAAGPLILKRHLGDLDPRVAMGASLAIAAVVLTPFAILQAPSRVPTTGALGAVVVLGLVCTALAFVLMALLIAEIGAARSVVITYVNPIIAVALGVALLGERPGAGAVAGLLLILAGSWLSTDGRVPPGIVAWLGARRVPRGRRGAASEGARPWEVPRENPRTGRTQGDSSGYHPRTCNQRELLHEQHLRVLRQRPQVVGHHLLQLVRRIPDGIHRGEHDVVHVGGFVENVP